MCYMDSELQKILKKRQQLFSGITDEDTAKK